MITRMRIDATGRTMAEVEATLKTAAAMIREKFESQPEGVAAPDMEMVCERDLEAGDPTWPHAYKGRCTIHLDVGDTGEQIEVLRRRGVDVATWPPPVELQMQAGPFQEAHPLDRFAGTGAVDART